MDKLKKVLDYSIDISFGYDITGEYEACYWVDHEMKSITCTSIEALMDLILEDLKNASI